MKKFLLVIATISSSALMAASIQDFEGKFEVRCESHPDNRYVVEVKYNAEKNYLGIKETEETSGDRTSYSSGYVDINAGKQVYKNSSETFGCIKRTEETKLSGNVLRATMVEKQCYLPLYIGKTVQELTLLENGDLIETLEAKVWGRNCEFKRIK